jgi:tetratricopeptide (TPR) repeat protein
MLRKFLFIAFVCFQSFISWGQLTKNQSSSRILKTANTLLEAQQFEAAEEYFKKGLSKTTLNKDYYGQALANEGLGNLYNKIDQPDLAIRHYTAAVKLYRGLKLTVVANVVESLLKSVQGIGDLYAGIEIGAKGVKMSIIEVKLSRDREYDYTLIGDTSINTDAAALSYQSEKETFDAITALWSIIKNRYHVDPKKVHIVISSGLKQELDKYNKVEYFSAVIRPKDLDLAIDITSITANQEAELSLLGIVPQKRRYTAAQLDVGSGNTKGGFFGIGRILYPITFPFGTKSFQRMIEAKNPADINAYIKTAEKYWSDSLRRLVLDEFAVKGDIRSRDVLYLSGGVVWAIVSLTHPESILNNYTDISVADISNFRKGITENYTQFTHPDLSPFLKNENAAVIQKNFNRALSTYDQKALLAGTIWLDELMKEINTQNPAKKIIYPKYAYVGWISGYIIKKVTQQYTGLVK